MASNTASTRHQVLLAAVVITFLPLLTIAVLFNYAAVVLLDQTKLLKRSRDHYKKTVLITGSSSAFGLNVARALRKSGCRVVGIDTDPRTALSVARESRAISKQYDLPELATAGDATYIGGLIFQIVKEEGVSLWINASQKLSARTVRSAQQLIQQQTACICITAEAEGKQHFRDRETLFSLLRACGLPTPESHKVRSRNQIHNLLNDSQGKKRFSLKSPETRVSAISEPVLPRRTLSQTYNDVSLVKIDSKSHLVMEEYVETKTSFICFALVVKGELKFFRVQEKVSERPELLLSNDGLRHALQSYTEALAQGVSETFSGHLTLSFGLNEMIDHAGVTHRIFPVDGSLDLDPAIAVAIDKQGFEDLAASYRSMTGDPRNGHTRAVAVKASGPALENNVHRYVLLQAITDLVVVPWIGFLFYRTGFRPLIDSIVNIFYSIVSSDELWYDPQDPLPAYWQNTVGLVIRA